MIRKVAGSVLLIVAAGIALMLLTRGRFVLPHVLGPIALAIAGVLLVVVPKRRIDGD
jgi:ABC-type enterochelin transport system permease subunit